MALSSFVQMDGSDLVPSTALIRDSTKYVFWPYCNINP